LKIPQGERWENSNPHLSLLLPCSLTFLLDLGSRARDPRETFARRKKKVRLGEERRKGWRPGEGGEKGGGGTSRWA